MDTAPVEKAATPISPGEVEVKADIVIVYEIR